MSDHLNALPAGYRFEEYEVVRLLGSGGFGLTYLGFDHNLDKPVAIKEYLPNDMAVRGQDSTVLPKSTADKEDFDWGLDRFLTEARTLARFDHPNLIRVFRFFRAHGTGYIVMEYAEGETLSEHFTRLGTLSETQLTAIMLPLMAGLEVVHAADFLHRDIKPGNIIIREDGSPVLIDFGAARQAVGAKSRSITSIVTPGYAPIEQYDTSGNQGPWTDIYALGAVAYKALTGSPPPDATGRMRRDPLVPATKAAEKRGSPAFLRAIDAALEVDEPDRPQSVAAWRTMISTDAGVGAPQPEPPKPEPPKPETIPPAETATPRSPRKWVGVAAAAIVVVIAGFGYSEYQAFQAEQDRLAIESAARDQTRIDQANADEAARREAARKAAAADAAFKQRIFDDLKITAALSNCDNLARHPGEKGTGPSVKLGDLNADKVIEACTAAVKLAPRNWRMIYQLGRGYWKKEDYKKARELMLAAAGAGHARAQGGYGVLLANGLGASSDDRRAAVWYQHAAKQDDATAQVNLARAYANGRGVTKNETEAARWYRRAAELGNASGQVSLGYSYSKGLGVSINTAEAIKWYRRAAEQGNAIGQNNLGVMYRDGLGVTQNYSESFKWFTRSAQQGNWNGELNLGHAYDAGQGVKANKLVAVTWYLKAAEEGVSTAQNNLGIMYEHGRGVKKNPSTALKWYRLAAAQGVQKAKDSVAKLEAKGFK